MVDRILEEAQHRALTVFTHVKAFLYFSAAVFVLVAAHRIY